jgi:hypothetical protein
MPIRDVHEGSGASIEYVIPETLGCPEVKGSARQRVQSMGLFIVLSNR